MIFYSVDLTPDRLWVDHMSSSLINKDDVLINRLILDDGGNGMLLTDVLSHPSFCCRNQNLPARQFSQLSSPIFLNSRCDILILSNQNQTSWASNELKARLRLTYSVFVSSL